MGSRVKIGQRASCKYCQQDIEFHGNLRWLDRGGNRSCVTYSDSERQEYVKPKTKHAR